ncbi:hypothetical protein PHLCEN_2v5985, partial [Hermanssonia centrifuga]
MRKIRDTTIVIHWFSGRWDNPIIEPPSIPSQSGLQVRDLYVHEFGGGNYQIWRCEQMNPLIWKSLPQGTQEILPGQNTSRAFVVTESGQPSWVLPHTIGRLYKWVQLDTNKGKQQ